MADTADNNHMKTDEEHRHEQLQQMSQQNASYDVDNTAGVGLNDDTVTNEDTMGVGQDRKDPLLGTEMDEEQDEERNDGTSSEGGVRSANERDDVTGLTEEERTEKQ